MNDSLNSIFPVLSLSGIAVASLLLTACSEPPAPAALVKPVFVTTATPANSAQLRSFTSVVRARVETELGPSDWSEPAWLEQPHLEPGRLQPRVRRDASGVPR